MSCLIAICLGDVSSASAADTNQPQEIVVTSPRRNVLLQDTGLTIDVVTAEDIELLNASSLENIASYSANVELFEDFPGAGIPAWIIRGVGLQDFNSNNTPAAAIYLDESYQTSNVMGARGLFDVQQIEVMKGPQGGLYGRNTSGGAVVLNTKRAEIGADDGYVSLGYGRWDALNAEAARNISISNTQALRLSGRIQNSDDDWQNSLSTGESWGGADRWDARIWYKNLLNENWTMELRLQAGEDQSKFTLARSIGVYNSTGDFCSAVLQGQRDDSSCLSFAGLNEGLLSMPVQQVASQSDDGSSVLSDPFNQQDSNYLSSGLYLKAEFDRFEFNSVTTLDQYDYGIQLDLDGSIGEFAHRESNSDINVLSQEFRLNSLPESSVDWLVGVSFSKEEFEERRSFLFRDNYLVIDSLKLNRGNIDYDQNTDMWALFGSAAYPVNEVVTFNASFRYTDEDKEYRNGTMYVPGPTPFVVLQGLQENYQLDKNISGSFGLDWNIDDSSLLYSTVSKGFKSGGFYGGFLSSPQEIAPYLEETIIAYEVGFKKDIEDINARINVAAFYYNYQDVQSFVTRINSFTSTPVDVLSNPADAEHKGLELSFEIFPTEELALGFDVAYLQAEFKNGRESSLDVTKAPRLLSGQRPYAPEYSGNVFVNYMKEVQGGYLFDVAVSYHFRDDFSGQLDNPVERAIFELEGYGLVSLFASLKSPSRKWEFFLKSNNLMNENYKTRVKSDGLNGYSEIFGSPVTYELGAKKVW